jgi:hypothetical protein
MRRVLIGLALLRDPLTERIGHRKWLRREALIRSRYPQNL